MTNEEIKKKICDIIAPYVSAYGDDERIADALIAAGLKFDVSYSFTAAFNSVQAERECDLERRLTAAEHRAEVAERALKIAEDLGELCAHAEDYIEQAEKELAEEKK